MPVKSASATELIADRDTQFDGRPTFLFRNNAIELRSDGTAFNPAKPDGMLAIHLGARDWANANAWLPGGTLEAISTNGEFVYRMPTVESGGLEEFAIPYSYRQSDVIGLKLTAPGMLPMEAVVSQMGMPGRQRRHVLTRGKVRLTDFRLFPADYADYRTILVLDAGGQPLADAMLVRDGQIYGRSNQSGVLTFPWPRPYQSGTKTWTPEDYFFLSAPSYVPVLLERAELESATTPVEVPLRARELLVSAHERIGDPSVLMLGGNASRTSVILQQGFDLVPIPETWQEINDWEDVYHVLAPRTLKLPTFATPDTTVLGPFEPEHEFGGEGARKMAEVLGRTPTEHWPEYAHWYHARWEYHEIEGRFDVVLPFPGRFLLLVGEYNYAPKGDEYNGKLTHVLYLDARDPAQLKSKLLVHPLG